MTAKQTCSHNGCNYPEGECDGACVTAWHAMLESLPRVAAPARGLPIDLVEPCPARVEGDRVPCHLFMPEVDWREPLPPVIRPDHNPDMVALSAARAWGLPVPWDSDQTIEPSTDLLGPEGFGRVVAVIGFVWVCAAAAALAGRLMGAV